MTIFTLNDIRNRDDICFENPNNIERLATDEEVLFDYALEIYEDLTERYEGPPAFPPLEDTAGNFTDITIYEKKKVKFNSDYVVDYICDNYYIESDEIEGLDELEKAIDEFNAKQTSYTIGKKLGLLDCSKDILMMLKQVDKRR